MSDIIDTSEDGYDTIHEDSILHTIQGVSERFGRSKKFKRYISRRLERVLLGIGLVLVIVVFWTQSMSGEAIPFLGMSFRLIGTLVGLIFCVFVLVFIFGSTIFLKTKAGGAKGAIKFNIISPQTGGRTNQMEFDMLIKRHEVLNRNMAQFSMFQDILDAHGKLTIDINKDDTLQESDYHLDDIRDDPVIAELLSEVEPSPKDRKIASPTKPPIPSRMENDYVRAPFDRDSSPHIETISTQASQQSVLIQHQKKYNQFDVKENEFVLAEITPLSSFFKDLDRFYVHVIDFTDDYEYNGMKQRGVIFIYPKENLYDILPQSDVAIFMTVGLTFGNIPSYHTDFVPIAYKGKVPIFYPLMTKERNLKLGNLGYFHETLPTPEAITSAKNLIELVVSKPLKFIFDDLLVQVKSYTEGIEKTTRKGMGFSTRVLNYNKVMHQPEKSVSHWWWAFGGFFGAVITYQWWIGIVQSIANWLGI